MSCRPIPKSLIPVLSEQERAEIQFEDEVTNKLMKDMKNMTEAMVDSIAKVHLDNIMGPDAQSITGCDGDKKCPILEVPSDDTKNLPSRDDAPPRKKGNTQRATVATDPVSSTTTALSDTTSSPEDPGDAAANDEATESAVIVASNKCGGVGEATTPSVAPVVDGARESSSGDAAADDPVSKGDVVEVVLDDTDASDEIADEDMSLSQLLSTYKLKELQEKLSSRGLNAKGKKNELGGRLFQALRQS